MLNTAFISCNPGSNSVKSDVTGWGPLDAPTEMAFALQDADKGRLLS